MNCSELRDIILDYIGEELVVEHRESFEAHLISCEHCTIYLESYRHTVTLTRKLTCGPLPPAFEARLRAALKDHFPE